jgi:hypothetical protein
LQAKPYLLKPTLLRSGSDRRRAREQSAWTPASSFDHLVGAGKQNFEAERSGGLEIDGRLVLRRRLHRQVGRLLAFEDAVHVAGRAANLVYQIRAIRDQAAPVTKNRSK